MSPGCGSEMRLRAANGDAAAPAQSGSVPAASAALPPAKVFKSPLDKKYHQERSALLGRGHSLSLTGFMNLLFCLTTLAGTGLLLENLNKYGFRVATTQWMRAFDARQNVPGFYPAVYLFLYMPVQIFVALGIEKAIALEKVSEAQGMKAHFVNLLWHVAYPVLGIWLAGDSISILGGVILCQFNAIVFLKMWSFVHACWWAREKRRQGSSGVAFSAVHTNGSSNGTQVAAELAKPPAPATEYPDNLTVSGLAYFTFAPTLCYEMDYPRNPSINWRRVIFRASLLLFVCFLHFCMIQQWLIPSYTAVLGPIARSEWSIVAERLCKIAIPNNLVWLNFFYMLFHVNMILVSELTRFADRRSYESWWDSEDMNVFWRRWNLPVHYWCIRHLYLPIIRMGYSKTTAKWATFVFSGIFHEYLVSPSLKMFRLYAFIGMLAQVPIGDFSEWVCKKLGPRWGNAVVWFSICVGQPANVLLYTRDYVVAYDGYEALAVLGTSALA